MKLSFCLFALFASLRDVAGAELLPDFLSSRLLQDVAPSIDQQVRPKYLWVLVSRWS